MGFSRFMSKTFGRLLRIVAGIILILVGALAASGVGQVVLIVVGAIPLGAGLLNVCVFGPLFGGPFLGRKALAQGGNGS